MRSAILVFALVLCESAALRTYAQNTSQKAAHDSNFLLDTSKPYVYFEQAHVGPRMPLRPGEPSVGIWLRLRNNCGVPIVIATIKNSEGNLGGETGVVDEVVPNPPSPGTETLTSGIGIYQKEDQPFLDIFLSPNVNEAEVRGAEQALKRAPQERKKTLARPHGYNSGYEPGTQILSVVKPGASVLFCVPLNHVSKEWHFEIPFRFALGHSDTTRQPYSYLAFFWDDMPEPYRSRKDSPINVQEPGEPGDRN